MSSIMLRTCWDGLESPLWLIRLNVPGPMLIAEVLNRLIPAQKLDALPERYHQKYISVQTE